MMRAPAATVALAAMMIASTPAPAIDPALASAAGQVLANQTSASVDDGAPRSGGLLGGIFGCAASGNLQTIGAVAGGALGGLLGNRIAGSGSRTLGTLLGGALGAAAGLAIGCKLQKNDRMRAERAAQQAVASNQSQTWRNVETGATGRVDVGNTMSLGDLKFASGVEPAAGFTKVGQSYVATSNANLRNAPGGTATILGRIERGQRVFVPAQVKGTQPWLLVAEGGVGQGYVLGSNFTRSTTTAAASNCKIVKQSVSVPGEAEATESYHACRGADGQWTMTRV